MTADTTIQHARGERVSGEVVAVGDELVRIYVRTLNPPSTQATYRSACARFVRWLQERHGREECQHKDAQTLHYVSVRRLRASLQACQRKCTN